MFRFSSRRLKTITILCLAVLLVVYSLHQSISGYSQNTRKKVQQDVNFPLSKKSEDNTTWNILIPLVSLGTRPKIVENFHVCLSSICKHSSIGITLTLHIVADNESQEKATRVIEELRKDLCKEKVRVKYHDVALAAQGLQPFMNVLQDLFTTNSRSYFSGTVFFLSIINHILFPDVSKLIILDADIKFRTDIKKLFKKFEEFSPSNLIGISHELQPTYRHITSQYRRGHPHTKVGAPPPAGNPGFNSGVLLMDLARIRISTLYKVYLSNSTRLRQLGKKYYFKGQFGDQGFYTLLGFEHPELFYILPCTWNRQLCTWWKDKGYEAVFDVYYNCEGFVNVYHGNCATPIPDD